LLAVATLPLIVGPGVLNNAPPITPESMRASDPFVAWVDFDVDPARKLFATFLLHFRQQTRHVSKPVALRFFGADVADQAHLTMQMKGLIGLRPALIVATSVSVAQVLNESRTAIPVYFISQSDPVRDGLVQSLIEPGSRTGYTFFVPLDVKTMEAIKRVFPAGKTVGMVVDTLWLEGKNMSPDLFDRCKSLGINAIMFKLDAEEDVRELLRDPRARGVDVWYVPYSQAAFDWGKEIAAVLGTTKLPTVYARRKFLEYGGLLSIQAIDEDAMDVWANSIESVMQGVPIGSIPIMRPKEVEVAVSNTALAALDPPTRKRIAREATVFQSN
jgi:ABC-type uncharacterized transport system substrate-binding protein